MHGVMHNQRRNACISLGPSFGAHRDDKCNNEHYGSALICLKMRALPTAIDELQQATRQSLTALIEGIYNIIPDLKTPKPRGRQTRGLLNFVGDVQSFLFGTEETRRIT